MQYLDVVEEGRQMIDDRRQKKARMGNRILSAVRRKLAHQRYHSVHNNIGKEGKQQESFVSIFHKKYEGFSWNSVLVTQKVNRKVFILHYKFINPQNV